MARDFVFVWQPNGDFPKSYVDRLMDRFAADGPFVEDWRCATGKAQVGDSAYVFGQGAEHRCIFAVGTIAGPLKLSSPVERYRYLPLRIEMIADPDIGGPDRSGSDQNPRRQCTAKHPPERCQLGGLGRPRPRCPPRKPAILELADVDPVSETLVTETPQMRIHLRLERNSAAARAAKSWHGCRCQACEFDFRQAYGDQGADFIEVHHRKPLGNLPRNQTIMLNVETDFAVLCANCHRMIHRLPDPGDLAALREVVTSQARDQR